MGLSALLPAILAIASIAMLVGARRRLRGTTLLAPWAWAIACLAAVGSVQALAALTGDAGPLVRSQYAAALTTLCPSMALLGARRPQDNAWQFIVASLLLVALLPAASSWAAGKSQFDLHPAWSWFLLALLVIGLVNHLFTRFWLSSGLVLLAQACLFWDHLPLRALGPGPLWPQSAGLAMALAAIVAAYAAAGRPAASHQPLDRLWLDFRDAYGLLWGLRLAERFNASALACGWNIRLDWRGFCTWQPDAPLDTADRRPPDADDPAAIARMFQSLLRRFVSPEWIETRKMRATT